MPKRAPQRSRPRASKAHQAIEGHIDEALRARQRAYAPYSRFKVGAVLIGESGRTYLGCNVENSSYGLCLCAERSAIARAVGDGEKRFKGVVIATQSEPPSPPCGMCRQSLAEFASDLPVILVNHKGERVDTTLAELLPLSFTRIYLDD